MARYERILDRLMSSTRYGERWARHWLDVAGYADSDGNGTDDSSRPYSYKYRDYVVRSINADKPLDRFVVEQLAGDELVPRPWNDLTPRENRIARRDRISAHGRRRHINGCGRRAAGGESGRRRHAQDRRLDTAWSHGGLCPVSRPSL